MTDTREYWVGTFKNGPILVYDPQLNVGTRETTIVLFNVRKGFTEEFKKQEMREKLNKIDDATVTNYAIQCYENWRKVKRNPKSKRATHCYRCKAKLNSQREGSCEKCGWIKCKCGACGCLWNYIYY